MATPYRINLPSYEGPLDLLLDLIRKQEMDIHNIPIAKVTEQYLDYLHQLEKLDIDVSADFIYMAATLIHIKSKMLLPADPLADPERAGRSARRTGPSFAGARKIQERRAASLPEAANRSARVVASGSLALYRRRGRRRTRRLARRSGQDVFSRCSNAARKSRKFELRHETVTIAQMMDRLRQRLMATDDPVSLIGFFETCETRNAMIVALLAVLEMVRMQAVILVQSELFARYRAAKAQNVRRRFRRPRRHVENRGAVSVISRALSSRARPALLRPASKRPTRAEG